MEVSRLQFSGMWQFDKNQNVEKNWNSPQTKSLSFSSFFVSSHTKMQKNWSHTCYSNTKNNSVQLSCLWVFTGLRLLKFHPFVGSACCVYVLRFLLVKLSIFAGNSPNCCISRCRSRPSTGYCATWRRRARRTRWGRRAWCTTSWGCWTGRRGRAITHGTRPTPPRCPGSSTPRTPPRRATPRRPRRKVSLKATFTQVAEHLAEGTTEMNGTPIDIILWLWLHSRSRECKMLQHQSIPKVMEAHCLLGLTCSLTFSPYFLWQHLRNCCGCVRESTTKKGIVVKHSALHLAFWKSTGWIRL